MQFLTYFDNALIIHGGGVFFYWLVFISLCHDTWMVWLLAVRVHVARLVKF